MTRGPSTGVVVWLLLCALYVALGVLGLVDGLWVVVPYIVAITLARVVDPRPRLRRLLGGAVIVGAAASIVVGATLGSRGAWLFGVVPADATRLLSVAGWSLGGVGALTLACAIVPVRRRLFRPLALDPRSAVHATAAGLYATTLVVMAGSFVLLYDDPGETILLYLSDPAISLLTDVPLALAGVGWLVVRDLRATVHRLGFRPLARRQLAWAGLVALIFVIAAGVLDRAEAWLLPEIYAREGRFTLKFANVSPWIGAPLVAVAAGFGEEAVFRGALQPRFGVVLTALLFAAVHVQYEIPGIAMIFVIGLALGALRERTSTTFTAVAHMLYDVAAFLLPDF